MRSAIFLDRDGVIIENREHYVRSWDDVAFIPGALRALKLLSPLDLAVVVVTNQAVVGKGIITLAQAEEINQRLLAEARAHGGRVDAAYLCPHRTDESCECRKPMPGMLLRAAREHDLDLARSVMVGDAITDMKAAHAAGVRAMLVKSGRGASELQSFSGRAWFDVAGDLADATELFLQTMRMTP